jgi:IS1 family transposase
VQDDGMNQLSTEQRAKVIQCLVEGCSQRATTRITGTSKKTVARLAMEIGVACQAFAERALVNLPCKRIQCDEIWAFIGCKGKNASTEDREERGMGDVWTWVALDPDTKLAAGWFVGDRSASSAYSLLRPLQKRLAHKVQLTTDGHQAYLIATEAAFSWIDLDFAQLIKIYGNAAGEGRYSPGQFQGAEKKTIKGTPDMAHVSTSHVERQNLTMRMSIRRFTRLTNAFSKKFEAHQAAVALHFVHYNYCRIHQTLRVTPAMQAGLTDHVWSLAELVGLLETPAAQIAA